MLVGWVVLTHGGSKAKGSSWNAGNTIPSISWHGPHRAMAIYAMLEPQTAWVLTTWYPHCVEPPSAAQFT